eukprot:scaffold3924_cov109-Cylindrotheca_fusiformis.AAC.8
MAPYATDNDSRQHRRQSTDDSASSITKRHLAVIPERFIRFEDTVDIVPYEKLTSEEKTDIWYTKQELSKFKQDCRKAVRRHHHGTSSPPPRGLEKRTAAGFQRSVKDRLSALAVVLQIQYVRDDPVRLANAYREVTMHCQLEAIDIAIRDHLEVASFDACCLEDGDDTSACLACFPLSPMSLSSLLNHFRKSRTLINTRF